MIRWDGSQWQTLLDYTDALHVDGVIAVAAGPSELTAVWPAFSTSEPPGDYPVITWHSVTTGCQPQ